MTVATEQGLVRVEHVTSKGSTRFLKPKSPSNLLAGRRSPRSSDAGSTAGSQPAAKGVAWFETDGVELDHPRTDGSVVDQG